MQRKEVVVLDEKDRAILRELQVDANLPMTELADRVGLSTSPCWRRVKRLEEEGVLLSRVALVDPSRVGIFLTAFAMVSLDRHIERGISSFHEAIQNAPEVITAYAVTGNVDFLLTVMVPDMAAYEYFLRRCLLGLEVVRSVNTSFSLRVVKASTAIPV